MKKFLVLFILFVLPLGAYLFITKGKINFEKLPILQEQVDDSIELGLKDHISVLAFIGNETEQAQLGILNLNQIVYKKLYQYKEFQVVCICREGTEEAMNDVKKELTTMMGSNLDKFKFVYLSEQAENDFVESLLLNPVINSNGFSQSVVIIDKDFRQRGRIDEEKRSVEDYSMFSASTLKNKLLDDVKIVFYEYNSALKEHQKRAY